MHKLNRNPISIDDNLKIVRKGLRAEQRAFFDAEKDNLKNVFEKYDSSSTTAPVSLETLRPMWAENKTDTPAQKSSKKEKRDRAFNLYGSNRPFVNYHWEALKAANGGKVLMCPICGLKECSEMDHYVPRSLFHEFSSHISNLLPPRHDCIQGKHDFWLNDEGQRRFFNAFFDRLPAKIIECIILEKDGFPQVQVTMSGELEETDQYDSIVLRTYVKLALLRKIQEKADSIMRSEIQRLMSDYFAQKAAYHDSRDEFWNSRVASYSDYIKHPDNFTFVDVAIFKAMVSSEIFKEWVVNSKEFCLCG